MPIFLTPTPFKPIAEALLRISWMATPYDRASREFSRLVSDDVAQQSAFNARMLTHPPKVRDAIYLAMLHGVALAPSTAFACAVGQILGADDDRFPGARPLMDRWVDYTGPDARIVIPGAGHMAHLEAPEQFADAIVMLLTRFAGGAGSAR